jgi:ethanolamine ammonia-lyase small subunit
MAYRSRRHHSDANRNLVANIHSRGGNSAKAAKRILNLAAQMMRGKVSGYTLRESMTSLADE